MTVAKKIDDSASQSSQENEVFREELIRRYSAISWTTPFHRMKFWVKNFAWKSVVQSAYILKRCFDIIVSAILMIVLMPFFLALTVIIRIESPGNVLFRQTRVGQWGSTFNMWKFRSMYIDAEERKAALSDDTSLSGVRFKIKKDPRITRIGRFIRKGSIDELPQLWNVFKGDMSLVGPRPPLPSEVWDYSLQDRRRMDVKPGITCIWQVSGRSDIPFDQQVELDVQYIESQSFGADLIILFKTIPAVFMGKGAY